MNATRILILAVLIAGPLCGQVAGEVATGTVLDADKKPVLKAKVTIKDKDGKAVAEVLTDATGKFSATVPVGKDYTLSVDADGVTLGGVQVPVNTVKDALRKVGELLLPPRKVVQGIVEEAKGTVLDPNRKPIPKAKVTIKAASTGQTTTVATNDAGEFRAQLPSDQSYDIAIEALGFGPVMLQTPKEGLQLVRVVLAHAPTPCCDEAGQISWWVIVICAIVYWIFAMVVRYQNILRVDRKLIGAEIEWMTREAEALAPGAASAKGRIDELLTAAKSLVHAAEASKLSSLAFGFRGHEVAAGTNVFNARVVLVETYTRDQIISGLRLAVEELRPEYANMAAKIEAALSLIGKDPNPETEFLRQELTNALRCVSEKKQAALRDVSNWQNKAFALVLGGCGLLAATAMKMGNPVLLFAGLLGGFTSRLLRGKTMNSAGGSMSWTTLFLSPIYGAFAGWAGVLLITMLVSLQILGDALKALSWSQASCSNIGLGLAFLFGFSERFFSAVTDMAEGALLKQKNASAADPADAKPAPADPKAGVQGTAVQPPSPAPSVTGTSLSGTILTLQGKNLKNVTDVKLKPGAGPEIPLVIQGREDEVLTAKAEAAPASGSYQVLLGGKAAGSVSVP